MILKILALSSAISLGCSVRGGHTLKRYTLKALDGKSHIEVEVGQLHVKIRSMKQH